MTKPKQGISIGVLAEIFLSLLFIVFGVIMLTPGGIPVIYFYYAVAALLCLLGLFAVCGYFIKKEYLDMTKYGFSVGLFMMIAGICMAVRARDFADTHVELFGMLLLINSVILLQYAIQVRMMEGKAAGVVMAFTAIEDVIAIISITEIGNIFQKFPQVYFGLLIFCGAIGLLSMILVRYRMYKLQMEQERNKERILEEDPTLFDGGHEALEPPAVLVLPAEEEAEEEAAAEPEESTPVL